MDEFSLISIQTITTLGSLAVFVGFIIVVVAAPIVFFTKQSSDTSGGATPPFHFIIWPAKVAQAFFNRFWGEVGKGWFGVLTWRSFSALRCQL